MSGVLELDFLPARMPAAEYNQTLMQELNWWLDEFVTDGVLWRENLFRKDHYFSGKGYQKLGYVCLLSARHHGKNDARTQACASVLAEAFRCMYERPPNANYWYGSYPEAKKDWGQGKCTWAPPGTIYDKSWGGLPSRWADGGTCGVDFGNACYNDHHYHFGYFVVSGAILVELKPEYKRNTRFVDFINNFIRDTSNPSKDDTYFPQFRAFDWFGNKKEYINGIQMLPLTPAVPLSRSQEFAIEEWNDQLAELVPTMDPNDRWKSLLITGNLAFHQPKQAFEIVKGTSRSDFDDGLTKIWAMYWSA